MPQFTSHQPGSFCWIELMTTDAAAARAFYTQLFGWTVNEIPMGEMGTYHMFRKGGRDAGAMYEEPRTRAAWQSYIAVSDADAAVEQVKSLGGGVLAGPMDVFDSGRMAVVSDPQGATFAVWQARQHHGVQVRDEPNALCWNELQARDIDAAKAFYTGLFRWRLKESDEYTEFHQGEHAVGGMMQSQAPPGVPSYWLPYFAVEDCDGEVGRATSLGATLMVPAMDIPNVGRFAILQDPQRATFAVIRLTL
jgi:uncharacterized protein